MLMRMCGVDDGGDAVSVTDVIFVVVFVFSVGSRVLFCANDIYLSFFVCSLFLIWKAKLNLQDSFAKHQHFRGVLLCSTSGQIN